MENVFGYLYQKVLKAQQEVVSEAPSYLSVRKPPETVIAPRKHAWIWDVKDCIPGFKKKRLVSIVYV